MIPAASGEAERFIAGQIHCRECGHTELLIKNTRRGWHRDHRCYWCNSKRTTIPMWWPVEDKAAISAALSTQATREATRMQRRAVMN